MKCIFTIREQDLPAADALYIDIRPGHREIRQGGLRLKLPLRQYKFMQCLMGNFPKPMTHWEMFYHVWGEGSQNSVDEDGGPLVASSCIEQLAAKLRKKLIPFGLSIEAPRKGYGYVITELIAEKLRAAA